MAYDDNGVVIPADPRVTTIFGSQIAFGQNPWGYEDERNLAAINLQIANNTYYSSALWLTAGQGTVKYPFGGVGYDIGTAGTTLCGSASCNGTGISTTDTSISVNDASKLSLGTLPTAILILSSSGNRAPEVIRICSASSLTGNATLGVCYNGRGISTSSTYTYGSVPAQSWLNGAVVGEMKITGSGTLFATDSQRPLAPAGVPGPMGPVTYSSGTTGEGVDPTHLVGVGTTWNTGNGSSCGVFHTHCRHSWRRDAVYLLVNHPHRYGHCALGDRPPASGRYRRRDRVLLQDHPESLPELGDVELRWYLSRP